MARASPPSSSHARMACSRAARMACGMRAYGIVQSKLQCIMTPWSYCLTLPYQRTSGSPMALLYPCCLKNPIAELSAYVRMLKQPSLTNCALNRFMSRVPNPCTCAAVETTQKASSAYPPSGSP
eukprot:scaffold11959_cov126-Isochrysis_galbana.AAC.2